jgi:hypothetical protein
MHSLLLFIPCASYGGGSLLLLLVSDLRFAQEGSICEDLKVGVAVHLPCVPAVASNNSFSVNIASRSPNVAKSLNCGLFFTVNAALKGN